MRCRAHDDVIKWKQISVLLALCAGNSPVTGDFFAQRSMTRRFDVFFDLRLNKRLSKQSWGWWCETPSRSFWRYPDVELTARQLYQTVIYLDWHDYWFTSDYPFTCRNRNNPVQYIKYHGWWCLGSSRRQDICTYEIHCVDKISSCLTWERIYQPAWCQCGEMSPMRNVARKGLKKKD